MLAFRIPQMLFQYKLDIITNHPTQMNHSANITPKNHLHSHIYISIPLQTYMYLQRVGYRKISRCVFKSITNSSEDVHIILHPKMISSIAHPTLIITKGRDSTAATKQKPLNHLGYQHYQTYDIKYIATQGHHQKQ